MFSYCSFPVQLLKSSDLGRHSLLYLKEIGHGWFGKVKHALLFWKHLITSYDTLSLGFFEMPFLCSLLLAVNSIIIELLLLQSAFYSVWNARVMWWWSHSSKANLTCARVLIPWEKRWNSQSKLLTIYSPVYAAVTLPEFAYHCFFFSCL